MQDSGHKTEWAESRTDWAEDRTVMANERTYASWMGAGMGLLAVAIGLKAVFGDFEPTWAAKLVASFFLLISVLLFWAARNRAVATASRLQTHRVKGRSAKMFTWLAVLLSLGSFSIGAILWSL